jgi:hypothetical protein
MNSSRLALPSLLVSTISKLTMNGGLRKGVAFAFYARREPTESLSGLGDEELAPSARSDGILHYRNK